LTFDFHAIFAFHPFFNSEQPPRMSSLEISRVGEAPMMPPRYRLALLALAIGGLTLVGCSGQSSTTKPTSTTHAASSSASGAASSTRASGTRSTKAPAASTAGSGTPDSTGIPACDDFLSSYVACHRAAAVYAPDEIQPRYEAMRSSLIRDSQDPNTRPQLGARCTALATQLRQALHGKSCAPMNPAASSSAH
jgi:hypothetical protein